YLPVIDGLADLLRGDQTAAVARLLKAVAPSWFAQVAPGSTSRVTEATPASSQQAIVREFVALLREVSRLGPVVLFFDDVHWADDSTTDLLAHLGRHVRSLRVLVIVTCRPTELLLGPHRFYRVLVELQEKGICTELTLPLLRRPQIDDYLA